MLLTGLTPWRLGCHILMVPCMSRVPCMLMIPIYVDDNEPMDFLEPPRPPPHRPPLNSTGMGGNPNYPNPQHVQNDDPFAKVKFFIHPFYGFYDAETYLDWEITVEQKFSSHLIPKQYSEEGDVMNTRIYTSLDSQSIIPYVQYRSMFPILISEGSSIQLGFLCHVLCMSSLPVAWAAFYSCLRGARQLPFRPS
jgi:hypothetical protein